MAWWEYPTNYSNGTAVDGVGKFFFRYPASLLSSFGSGIILLIWVFAFIILLGFGVMRAMAAASFISFVFSLFLYFMGSINPIVPIILIVLTIIGAIGARSPGSSTL